MRNLWTTLAVAVLVLALLGAGCGDSDGDDNGASGDSASSATSDATSTIEQAAFVKKANAICEANRKRVRAGIEDVVSKAKKIPDVGDTANLITPILVASLRQQIDSLRALAVSSGDKDQVEALLDAYQAWVDKAESDPKAIVQSADAYNEARQLAGESGLAICAKGPLDP